MVRKHEDMTDAVHTRRRRAHHARALTTAVTAQSNARTGKHNTRAPSTRTTWPRS
jgi:hypothetical protein